MDIVKNRWPQFKQELLTFIYLSTIQVWINFNFPTFIKQVHPFNIIIPTLLSIICISIYLLILIFPETLSFIIDDTLNSAEYLLSSASQTSNPLLFKRIYIGFLVVLFHAVYLYNWHRNYYGLPNIWYIILYVHSISIFILIYKAFQRYKNKII